MSVIMVAVTQRTLPIPGPTDLVSLTGPGETPRVCSASDLALSLSFLCTDGGTHGWISHPSTILVGIRVIPASSTEILLNCTTSEELFYERLNLNISPDWCQSFSWAGVPVLGSGHPCHVSWAQPAVGPAVCSLPLTADSAGHSQHHSLLEPSSASHHQWLNPSSRETCYTDH